MAKIRIPGNYFSVTPERHKTVHVMNRQTGQMTGRHNTTGQGDRTSNIRATKYFDLNKDKRRDAGDVFPGQILGRMSKGESKPKSLESVNVREHHRGKTEVRHHFRKVPR